MVENGRGASEPHGRPWPIVLRSHEFQGRLRQTGSTAGSRVREGLGILFLSFIRLPSDLPPFPRPLHPVAPSLHLALPVSLARSGFLTGDQLNCSFSPFVTLFGLWRITIRHYGD